MPGVPVKMERSMTFSFIYFLTVGLGLATAVFWVLRQRGQSIVKSLKIQDKLASEKMFGFLLAFLVFQSIAALLNSKGVFNGSALFWGLMTAGDLIVLVLFYLYIRSLTNGTSSSRKYLLHFLVPLLMLIPLVKLGAELQKEPFFQQLLNRSESKRFRPDMASMGRFGKERPSPFMFIRREVLLQVDVLLWTHTGVSPVLSQSVSGRPWGKMTWGNRFNKNKVTRASTMGAALRLLGWLYMALMTIHLFKYAKSVRPRASVKERETVMWLTVLVTVLGVVQAMLTFLFIAGPSMGRLFFFFRVRNDFPVTMIYIIAIGGYLLFTRNRPVEEKKYGKNLLSAAQLERYYRALIKYMNENKPYREETLTLKQLAETLDIHPNDLSQVINIKQGCNFKDFINSFRVAEVKKALLEMENKDKNILTIAYDAGFHSKSGFNLVFKKHTDMTPSEYLKGVAPPADKRVAPPAYKKVAPGDVSTSEKIPYYKRKFQIT